MTESSIALFTWIYSRVLCRRVEEKYTFIKDRRLRYPVRTLCRALEIHPSAFYAWLVNPLSKRAKEDEYLFLKQSSV